MPTLFNYLKAKARKLAFVVAPKFMYTREILAMGKEPELMLLPELCNPAAASLDIGSYVGQYIYYMRGCSGGVIAFEPQPTNIKRLRTLFGTTVTIHEVALSNAAGVAKIRVPKGVRGLGTIEAHNTLPGHTDLDIIDVATKRLDDFALSNVGFIKIDVEGHEEAILHGAEDTIRRCRPNLLIEVEERHHQGSVGRVAAFLGDLGYRAFYLDGGALKPFETFDLERDQPAASIIGGVKTGRYINNFIFKPAN